MGIYRIKQAAHIDPQIEANPNFISSIKFAEPVHCHDFYEFFLITKGRCIHKVNNESQYLAEGSLVFVRPEDKHYYDYDGDSDCEFINIACMDKVMQDVFLYLGDRSFWEQFLTQKMPPHTMLSSLEKDNLINRYERFKMLSTIDKPQARIQLRSMLVEMLTQYFPVSKDVSSRDIPLWMESLLTQMQKKENFTKGLEKMYEISGRSVGHLNRVFKQYLNTTPTAYINHLRLGFAKGLLLTTELSIVEVALESGFENLSHFYHLFKQHFNATPADMRGGRRTA